MRRLAATIIFASLLCPVSAFAGAANSGFTASHEKGVAVYRGVHPQHNFDAVARMQHQHQHRAEQAAIKSRLAMQQRQLAKQRKDVKRLQARLDAKQDMRKPRARARFGRKYYGNSRFFGRNGFIGNSNFSGATQPLPRRQRRQYRRKHH